MTEEWRAVPGFPDYEVSNTGRVVSLKKGGRLEIKGSYGGDLGYRYVRFYIKGCKWDRTVHSVVASAFHGPRPEGMVVRHLDGDHLNNAASNLTWGTQSENLRDTVAHGKHHGANRTHCAQGHPFDEANTWRSPTKGNRRCRPCMKARKVKYEARRNQP